MKKYDLIFLGNIPSFYRDELFNQISRKVNILVIYMSKKDSNDRNKDFYSKNRNFDYKYLSESDYLRRNRLINSFILIKLLKRINYKYFFITQWDGLESWVSILFSPKRKNCLVMESSIFESDVSVMKRLLKKLFVSRIKYGFPSGSSQNELLKKVGFKGKSFKTKGVGIFRKNRTEKKMKIVSKDIKNFIYVGRLASEKNLEQLLRIFRKKSDLNLNIIGTGPLEKKLKKMASSNVKFLGYINNSKLKGIYNKNEVFILPSTKEPWGLVVEEALYNGLPVILSDRVGCSTEIITEGKHGLVYNVESDEELINKIVFISDLKNYAEFQKNVKNIDFDKRDKDQVMSYLKVLN